MHYINFLKSSRFPLLLLALLSLNIGLQAQNATPPPTIPQGKVDPSQVSNQQAVEFYNKAKSAGMSDMDIERAAMQRGYTLDDISTMRKKLQQNSKEKAENTLKRNELDETRKEEDESESSNRNNSDSTKTTNSIKQKINKAFGSTFFNYSSNTFEPNLRIATPQNYILGPDDELIVDIYGNYSDNFKLKVSAEGTVKMLNLAPVYVNGLTIEQARERIVSRLREAYSSLNRSGSGTYSSITLGSVRSIRIMVAGEASQPGTYTVSSLATAFNVLSISGGPNENGTYRNIEIIRNNKLIRVIDLYKFLVNGDLKDNISLQDQDIILIRPYITRIEFKGQIKRPGIFESLPDEKLSTLITYAGGYTPEANSKLLMYQRSTGKNYIIGGIDSTQVNSFKVQNGDILLVKRIQEIITNQVEIIGAITQPGIYPIEERSNTLMKVIQIAQGLGQKAFLNRGIIERSSGSSENGIIAFDLRKIMNGEDEDIPLFPGDIITIKNIDDLKETNFLTVSGSIINPGEYYYFHGITVADLVFQAGGFTQGGIPYRIEVSRRIKNDTLDLPSSQNVRIFTMNIPENLKIDSNEQTFTLQPFDMVMVRKSPRYEPQKIVTILGEVKYPGIYTIQTDMERLSDLFPKAGGALSGAYIKGAKLYRGNELVALDISTIIKKPSSASNLLLKHGDTLIVPKKSETVRIQGGVHNPSMMNYDPTYSYKEYISQAGGYTVNAWKNRVYVSYPNGRTHRTKKWIFRSYPKIEPGSIVTIPVKEEKPRQATTPGERIAIVTMISTLSIAIISLINNLNSN